MVTFNQIKNLIDQGIFPCIIDDQRGKIDYLTSYDIDLDVFHPLFSNSYFCIDNGELQEVIGK